LARPVVIVDYDFRWPALFEEEKRRVVEMAGRMVLAVEHIGSTAVPGLGAKPIIDMMAGVHGPSDADQCVPTLRQIGYDDITSEEELDWYYCCGRRAHGVGYHLHLVRFMSPLWAKHLLFRDYLRTHPKVAQQYHELKKILAAKHGSDRTGYTSAKASFIESVVAQALSPGA